MEDELEIWWKNNKERLQLEYDEWITSLSDEELKRVRIDNQNILSQLFKPRSQDGQIS